MCRKPSGSRSPPGSVPGPASAGTAGPTNEAASGFRKTYSGDEFGDGIPKTLWKGQFNEKCIVFSPKIMETQNIRKLKGVCVCLCVCVHTRVFPRTRHEMVGEGVGRADSNSEVPPCQPVGP